MIKIDIKFFALLILLLNTSACSYNKNSYIYDNFIDEIINAGSTEKLVSALTEKLSVGDDANYSEILNEYASKYVFNDKYRARLSQGYREIFTPDEMKVYVSAHNSEACRAMLNLETVIQAKLVNQNVEALDNTISKEKIVACYSLLEHSTTVKQREEIKALLSSITDEFVRSTHPQLVEMIKKYKLIKGIVNRTKKEMEFPVAVDEFQIYLDVIAGHNYLENVYVYKDTFSENEILDIDKNDLRARACETSDVLKMGINEHYTWLDINHQHLMTYVITEEDC